MASHRVRVPGFEHVLAGDLGDVLLEHGHAIDPGCEHGKQDEYHDRECGGEPRANLHSSKHKIASP